MGVVTKVREWRWTPFFAITGGALFYVVVAEIAVAAAMPDAGQPDTPQEPVNVIGDEPAMGDPELAAPARAVPPPMTGAMLKGSTPVPPAPPSPVIPPPPPEPSPPHLDPNVGPSPDAPAIPVPPPVQLAPEAEQEVEEEGEEEPETEAPPQPHAVPSHIVTSPGVLRSITRRAQEIAGQPQPPQDDVAEDEAE